MTELIINGQKIDCERYIYDVETPHNQYTILWGKDSGTYVAIGPSTYTIIADDNNVVKCGYCDHVSMDYNKDNQSLTVVDIEPKPKLKVTHRKISDYS